MRYLDNIPDDRSRLVYNGIDLRKYGLYVSGGKTFNSPKKEYTKVSIPGRSGDLVISNGRFSNVTVEYEAILIEDYEENTAMLRSILLSPNEYVRIEDSYHPDEYRMGIFEGPLDFDTVLLEAGSCTLKFNCQPQRWLKDGETELIIAGNPHYVRSISEYSLLVNNKTMFDAKPLFKFEGYGVINCEIGNISSRQYFTLDFTNAPYYLPIYVDSETMNCYREGYDTTKENGNKTTAIVTNYVPGGMYGENYLTWSTDYTITHLGFGPSDIEYATLNLGLGFRKYVGDNHNLSDLLELEVTIVPGDDLQAIQRTFDIGEFIMRGSGTTSDTWIDKSYQVGFYYAKNTITPLQITLTINSKDTSTLVVDPTDVGNNIQIISFVPVSESMVSANEYIVVDEFPVLKPGRSRITVSADSSTGGIYEATVTPRWYIV